MRLIILLLALLAPGLKLCARLERAVAFLDKVESDFAPHEASQTSRQRCIVDVNARFLSNIAV